MIQTKDKGKREQWIDETNEKHIIIITLDINNSNTLIKRQMSPDHHRKDANLFQYLNYVKSYVCLQKLEKIPHPTTKIKVPRAKAKKGMGHCVPQSQVQ